MNWLTDVVRPRISGLWQKRDTAENLWRKCGHCGEMIFHHDLDANQNVCTNCSHHMRIEPVRRLERLFDGGTYETLDTPEVPTDPLSFRDEKRYAERLKEAVAKSRQKDTMILSVGRIKGVEAVVLIQNFAFMGGSLGMAAGEAFLSAAQAAVKRRAPLIIFTAAGGARMQEGILSLMQMPRTTIGVQKLREAGLPYIVVLTDPTTGGVTASYGMLGDIHLAEPGALIGFAGPRVIEQTIRERLPEGFQRAEYLLEHGMVDMVVHRHELPDMLGRIIRLLMHKHSGISRSMGEMAVPPVAMAPPPVSHRAAQPADGEDLLKDAAE